MSKSRQLADLLDSNGDVVVGALDNAPDPDLTPYATTTYVDTEISAFDPLPIQTGNSGGFLTTDGSTTSWGTVTVPTATSDLSNDSGFVTASEAGKVLQVVRNSYNSRYSGSGYTTAPFSPQGRGVGYNNAVKMQCAITKISSTSHLYIMVNACIKQGTNGHNTHGFIIWKDSSTHTSTGDNFGDRTSYNGPFNMDSRCIFTGLGTGSHTIYWAPARSDGTSFGCVLNPNSSDVGGGHVPLPTNGSLITIMEVEV